MSRLSRRDLLGAGLARARAAAADRVPMPPSRPPAPPAPPAPPLRERLDAALAAGVSEAGCEPVADAVLDAAGVGPGDRVRADGVLARCAQARGAHPVPDGLEADACVALFTPGYAARPPAAMSAVLTAAPRAALATWRGVGVVGQALRLAAEADPRPGRVTPPLTWGRDERLRQDVPEGEPASLGLVELPFATTEAAVDGLVALLPPVAALPPRERAEVRAALAALIAERATPGPGGALLVSGGYAVTRRAPSGGG